MIDSDHYRKLERLYLEAPTNLYYNPLIEISQGAATIRIPFRPEFLHAAQAVHGSVYFKALDDAAFFAANSVVKEVFVLTASFTLDFLRPLSEGAMTAIGRVLQVSRRRILAEADLFDERDRVIALGRGSFMRSSIQLGPEVGYK